MGWGDKQVAFPELGTGSTYQPGKIANVRLLGSGAKLKWIQAADGLKVELPAQRPCDDAVAFRVEHA